MKKQRIIVILFLILFIIGIIVCLNLPEKKDTILENSSQISENKTTDKEQKDSQNNSNIIDQINLQEIKINSNQILNLGYDEILKIWGTPKSINAYDVHFPATPEAYKLNILTYDSLDIEMYPLKDESVNKATSFRFDIYGLKYEFEGIKIGMDTNSIQKIYGNRKQYNVESILQPSENKSLEEICIQKIITDLKPNNYYNSYQKAIYIGDILQGENSSASGIVVLLNDNKVARIVFGLPTAG